MTLDVLGGLKSQDVELLLDLLAETNGVEVALRILTQLDVQFHEAWKVRGVKQLVHTIEKKITISDLQSIKKW